MKKWISKRDSIKKDLSVDYSILKENGTTDPIYEILVKINKPNENKIINNNL